jgi:chaperonin GroES
MVEFTQKLIGDMVAIEPEVQPKTLIRLPDWQRTLRGKVLAIGPGDPMAAGGFKPMMCKVGDTVIFGAATGMESSYKGALVRIMKDTDVDAVVA